MQLKKKNQRAVAKKGNKDFAASMMNWWTEWKLYVISVVVAVVLVGLTPLCFYLARFIGLVLQHQKPWGAHLWSWFDVYMSTPGIIPPRSLLKPFAMAAAITYVAIPGILIALVAAGFRKKRELHGSARWATSSEINKALGGSDQGIIVGKNNGEMLRFPGQQFVLLAAPTRSGKGVGVVIPNCLYYEHSIVVLDLKQENYKKTAGFRQKHLGHEVFLFNPFADEAENGKIVPRSHRYNPLSCISKGPLRVGDIWSIGNALWPTASSDDKSAFWNDNAKNLFLAVVLFLSELADRRAETEQELPDYSVTMGEVLRQTSGRGSGKPIKKYLADLLEQYDWLSPECRDAMSNFLSSSDDVLASILSTFNAPLAIFRNPIVDCATSACDFDIRDVRKKKMSIYIGIKPDQLPNAGLLLNLFFSQLVNLNTKELPEDNPELKYSCLLAMDEFIAMGKVAIIAKAVSYIAGYNLRLMPFIQSVAQLESVYGREDTRTFVTNHAMQIIYAPQEQKDANEYSEMLGYFTMKSASISRPKGMGGKNGGMSESVSDQRRALMLPQELKELGQWKEIILLQNTKPIICEKIKYFEDEEFTSRLLPAPAIPAMNIDLFVCKNQNRSRDLNNSDVDFDHEGLKEPPGAMALEMFDGAPIPPAEEPFDDYIDDSLHCMGVAPEDTTMAREEMQKLKNFEEQGRDFKPAEVVNTISFTTEDMGGMFADSAEEEFSRLSDERFEELSVASKA